MQRRVSFAQGGRGVLSADAAAAGRQSAAEAGRVARHATHVLGRTRTARRRDERGGIGVICCVFGIKGSQGYAGYLLARKVLSIMRMKMHEHVMPAVTHRPVRFTHSSRSFSGYALDCSSW